MNTSELPETLDAEHASVQLKRLLLYQAGQGAAGDLEDAPMADVLEACCRDSVMPWLLAAAISTCTVSGRPVCGATYAYAWELGGGSCWQHFTAPAELACMP